MLRLEDVRKACETAQEARPKESRYEAERRANEAMKGLDDAAEMVEAYSREIEGFEKAQAEFERQERIAIAAAERFARQQLSRICAEIAANPEKYDGMKSWHKRTRKALDELEERYGVTLWKSGGSLEAAFRHLGIEGERSAYVFDDDPDTGWDFEKKALSSELAARFEPFDGGTMEDAQKLADGFTKAAEAIKAEKKRHEKALEEIMAPYSESFYFYDLLEAVR